MKEMPEVKQDLGDKEFKPGEVVTWTKEAVSQLDSHDLLDSALVVEGIAYEVLSMENGKAIIRRQGATEDKGFPANPKFLERI
jgi:hypothetical protein